MLRKMRFRQKNGFLIKKRVSQAKLHIKGALSGLRQFLAAESALKMMKNAYFISKAVFVLKIFKFSLTF